MDIKTTAKQHTNSARCALGTRAVTPNLAVPIEFIDFGVN